MKRTRALKITALPAVLLTALALAGCTSGGGPGGSAIANDASGNACAAAGDASNAIEVDGEFGEMVSLTSTTPTAQVEELQRTVLIEGESTPFDEGQVSTANWTIIDGQSGELVNHIPDQKIPNSVEALVGSEWMYELSRCGAVGQRVVGVLSAEQALGGEDPANLGFTDLTSEDSFVMVVDFTAAEEACDAVVPRDEQYPEVDLGDGSTEPLITIPSCMEPPTELEIEVLVEGDGAVVEENQLIMTNYVGVDWNGAERFDGNWSETGVQFDTTPGALVDGFTQAMVGQKIGSTVLVTMPPEMGYGAEGTSSHALAGKTLTFVLQLVAAAS